MIEDIKENLGKLVAQHKGTTALLLSGGSDSLLLLHMLMEIKAEFQCLTLDNSFSRAQKMVIDRLVARFGIRVFSYRPAYSYFLGDGEKQVSMVEEYAIAGGTVRPFVRDCVHDASKCIYDTTIPEPVPVQPPIAFSLYISGARFWDRHYTIGRAWQEPVSEVGNVTFVAPLWRLTRKDVKKALAEYDEPMPVLDTGTLGICLTCMTAKDLVVCPKSGATIEPFPWKPTETLAGFRDRFGLKK